MIVFGIVLKLDERQQSRRHVIRNWPLRGCGAIFAQMNWISLLNALAESHNPTSINFMASVRNDRSSKRSSSSSVSLIKFSFSFPFSKLASLSRIC